MDSDLCSKCKSFFGSKEGLCSKCYKEVKPLTNITQTATELINAIATNTEESKNSPSVSTDRCAFCRKKLPPINFKCRCSYLFCSQHRLPEEHQCTYDHKAVGIRKLSEENPVIQAEKFNKL